MGPYSQDVETDGLAHTALTLSFVAQLVSWSVGQFCNILKKIITKIVLLCFIGKTYLLVAFLSLCCRR